MLSPARDVIMLVTVCIMFVSSRHLEKVPVVDVQSGSNKNDVNQFDSCSDSNCTWYEVVTTKDVTNLNDTLADNLVFFPLWCPYNYQLMSVNRTWYRLCSPQPCVDLPALDPHLKHLSLDKPHVDHWVINETSSSRRMCSKDLNSFRIRFRPSNCQRVKLLPDEFEIGHDGSLIDKVDNHTLSLGEYFIQMDQAIICRDSTHSLHSDDVIWSCIPFTVSPGKYSISANGSLIVNSISIEISPGFYYVDTTSNAHVCFRTHKLLESCTFLIDLFPKDQMILFDNFTLHTHKAVEVRYPVGQFIISKDRSRAIVCTRVDSPKTKRTSLLYGVASIISAVFSFATLVIHLIFPNINHHARSLMCHIISLFLMYLIAAIRYFVNDFDIGVARLAMFACQYVFSLSTFFWLNVISFELWHAFTKLEGCIAPGPRNEKKRWFLVKCVYSWGIPVILCFITIGISLSSNAQRTLGMMLPLSETIWFSSKITSFTFFYGPILVILIINLVLFGWTILNIRKLNQGSDILNSRISKQLLRVFLKLFVVMGLCWFAEIASWYLWDKTFEELWYLTDLINCLQGLAIFIIYVCKKSTVRIMKKKLNGEVGGGSLSTKSTSSQRSRRNTDNGASPTIVLRPLPFPVAGSTNENLRGPNNNAELQL